MNKLLLFRATIITFLTVCFISSFKLETEADCLIMFFTFMMSIGYLGAEIVIKLDKAEPKSYIHTNQKDKNMNQLRHI